MHAYDQHTFFFAIIDMQMGVQFIFL